MRGIVAGLSARGMFAPDKEHVCLLGLGISRVWTGVFFIVLAFQPSLSTGFLTHINFANLLFFAIGGLLALLAAGFAGHLVPGDSTLRLAARAIAGGGTCAAALVIATRLPVVQGAAGLLTVIGVAGALLGGVTLALLRLAWGCVYGRLDPRSIGAYSSLAYLVAFGVAAATRLIPPAFSAVLLLGLPACAAWCLDRSSALPESGPEPRGHANPSVRPFLPLALGIFVFTLASTTLSSYCNGGGTVEWLAHWQSFLSTFFVAVVLLVLYTVARRVDVLQIYRWVLPIMVAGYTVFCLLPGSHQVVGSLLTSVGYELFDLLSWIVMATYVRNSQANGLRVFGLGVGATLVGRPCGQVLGSVLLGCYNAGAIAHESVALLMVLLLVLLCVVILPERSLERLAKVAPAPAPDGTPVGAVAPDYTDRCLAYARAIGLTPRETDVLVMLARGRTAQVIGRDLSIATGTVQAHIKHIYAKADVHTQQELIDHIDGEKPL